jgi:hypothetical protein
MLTARGIEQAERQLHELRTEEWSDLALAAVAMALALGASAAQSALAGPLLVGAFVVGVLSVRAFVRRADFCDRLLLDRDSYAIPEIRRRAETAASMESRRELALSIRTRLTPVPGFPLAARVAEAAEELAALAAELDDEALALDPACAVRCRRLLMNSMDSPLINDLLPADDVLTEIRHVRLGFECRRAT